MVFWNKFLKGAAFVAATVAAWGVVVLLAFFIWTAIGAAGYFAGMVLP